MSGLFQRLVPRKNHFVGVDVGAYAIKAVEVKLFDSHAEAVSLRSFPTPPGVWTEQFDEEALVAALRQVYPPLPEVISCIGGEKVITRGVRFPVMSDRELATAVEIEIGKFLPISTEQMIVRHVRLSGGDLEPAKGGTRDYSSIQSEGQNVLLLAVPASTVYQYHSIFSRAGMTVTAFDLQAFALWRVYGRQSTGTIAIIDVGAKTSQFVVVKNGAIRFVRLLPVGGENLTRSIVDALGVDPNQAQQYKEQASVARDSEVYQQGGMLQRVGDVLREGLTEFVKEVRRSLSFCSAQEGLNVEGIVLSGGTSRLKGITDYCQEMLELKTAIGTSDAVTPDLNFDPAYAVALGLAMRSIEP
jgi:type IV pilus assembly protein PilM